MPRFAANLTMMFNEVAFLDRFERAAAAGFEAVEFLFPYPFPVDAILSRLERHGLELAMFNLPAGDWAAGERGIACIANRLSEVLEGLDLALPYARATGVRRLHLMAGLGDRHDRAHRVAYMSALLEVGGRLADEGLELLIEPINRRDMPGYFLHTTTQAAALIARIDRPNVALQLDLYHAQISEGDLERRIRALFPLVGHVQIAGNPARHEPDVGEVNYRHLLGVLDELGYRGWIGCEYRPAAGTVAGLGWAQPYLAPKVTRFQGV